MVTNIKVNTRWFRDRLLDLQISQRQLAHKIGLDASAVSLVLRGKRKVTAGEIVALANALGASKEAIMLHLGTPGAVTANSMPVTAILDAAGAISKGRADAGLDRVPAPPEMADNAAAFLYQGTGEMDGWVFYADKAPGVPREAIGRLAVVTLEAKGSPRVLRLVRHGYQAGKFNLLAWGGFEGEVLRNVAIKSAAPILWIKAN